jgi:Fur family peroxide stress response transcriptional regulator
MDDIKIHRLKGAGLKVTPQRLAVLEAMEKLGGHPTAERITEFVRKEHPGISTGTVYNVLGVLVEKGLIRRVKTEMDVMHYDGILENHHHLYCMDTDRIEDYVDEELDELLREYFSRRNIPGFRIGEIKLQINGEFLKQNK